MFIDETVLKVIAGKGGDGCTSFRREKYVAMGGPDGGNGGKGSSIIFEVDKGLKTLVDLHYMKIIKGKKGDNGKGKNKNGKNADDIIIKVPEGTTITDLRTNLIVADLVGVNNKFIVAKGGRGGHGNAFFKSKKDNAPKYSELGEPGEEKKIKLELKLLADVGLIGLPSVGKSTILGKISEAKPKVASYHFTTLVPNLGVVKLDNKSFVIADLPGLVLGAHEGIGLGDKFLKHASRTKILVHVIDMGASEGRNPIDDYNTIRNELSCYSDALASKNEVIVANKMDLASARENLARFKKEFPHKDIIEISALNNDGLDKLVYYLSDLLNNLEDYSNDNLVNEVIYKYDDEKTFNITKEDNIWVIRGEKIEKIFKMTRFDEDEAVKRFAKKMNSLGVDDELQKLGAKDGDEVSICDYLFIYKS